MCCNLQVLLVKRNKYAQSSENKFKENSIYLPIMSLNFRGSATVNRESRDGLALCQFKEDIVVECNKHKHVYLCALTKGLMKKVHANCYDMISEERHNGNYN